MPMLLNFRIKYGLQFIINDDLGEKLESYQMTLKGCPTLCHAPPHARAFCNHHWVSDAPQRYQQYTVGTWAA